MFALGPIKCSRFIGRIRSKLPVCVLTCLSLPLAVFSQVGWADQDHDGQTADILSEAEWQEVDQSARRGLAWLASQQQPDGSFHTLLQGQPGVSSLCALAFMSHGHLPNRGPYGDQLQMAIDFVLSCQKRNGLLALTAPNSERLSRNLTIQDFERYHYCLLTCTQAMYQLGGKYGDQYFPLTAKMVLSGQQPDGSWLPENFRDTIYGPTYTSALCLIALGTPNDLLPILQR